MGGQQITVGLDQPPNLGAPPNLAPWVAIRGARLSRYFARLAPTYAVDDLVQDVFRCLQSARSRGPIRNMESYLVTIARRMLVNRRRGLAHQPGQSLSTPSPCREIGATL